MRTKIAVGAEVDFITKGEMEQVLAEHRRAVAKMLRTVPIPKTIEGTIQLDATGAGVIDLGVPNPGRTWNVRRVSVSYQDPTAALAAGIAAIMRGNDPTNPLNFVERIGNGTQIPGANKYSADQLVLAQDEHLFIRVSAGTVSVFAFGSAQVLDSPKGTVYDLDLEEAPKLSRVV